MLNLNRQELSFILSALGAEREQLREEIANDPVWAHRLLAAPDYRALVMLQEKLLAYRDKMAY